MLEASREKVVNKLYEWENKGYLPRLNEDPSRPSAPEDSKARAEES